MNDLSILRKRQVVFDLARGARTMTQKDLADLLGVWPNTVARYESAKVESVDPRRVLQQYEACFEVRKEAYRIEMNRLREERQLAKDKKRADREAVRKARRKIYHAARRETIAKAQEIWKENRHIPGNCPTRKIEAVELMRRHGEGSVGSNGPPEE